MAIKANASSQGAGEFKRFVGVGSFRVLGVNPSKEELENFYGNSRETEPVYLSDAVDDRDGNKPYKRLRVTFMIQADDPSNVSAENKETARTNAALKEPLKTTVSFFLDSRYFYNKDKTKVQVIDKYGRTAWVTIEQCKNHQIPVYSNGPAKIDKDYRPAFRGEEELTEFIDNYLNITPIETFNRNAGQWITNSHPEDCEGWLEDIKTYFTGNVSQLKEYCGYMPSNCIKLLLGVRTDDQGKLFNTVFTRLTLRNGSNSYTRFKDAIDSLQNAQNTVWSNDPIGVIKNIEEYKDSVQETNLNNVATTDSVDPFAQAAAIPEAGSDLPFGNDDPFANM